MVLGKRGHERRPLVDEQEADRRQHAHGSAPTRSWASGRGSINYRQIQLDKLANVEVIPKTRLDAEGVLNYGAEIVVIATGARWRADGMNGATQTPMPGAELDFVYTPEQVVAAGGEIDGEQRLVYDTDGYFTAVAMAEMLLAAGKRVTVVTRRPPTSPRTCSSPARASASTASCARRGDRRSPAPAHEIAAGGARGQQRLVARTRSSGRPTRSCSSPSASPHDALYHELTADPARLAARGDRGRLPDRRLRGAAD